MMLRNLVRFVLTTVILIPAQLACGASNGIQARAPNNAATFHMSFGSPAEKRMARRSRALVYLTSDGFVTNDRNLATVFHINNERLTAQGDYVSANSNDSYISFAADATLKEIATTWTPAFFPVWSNQAFAGDHKATYCRGSDDRVYIVLKSPPGICTEKVFASTYPVPSATGTSPGNTSSAMFTTSPPKSAVTSALITSSSNATNTTSTSINQVARATSIIEARDYHSFCSQYLGYTTPVTTSTVTQNSTVTARSTQISGVFTTSTNATYNTTQTVATSTVTDTTTPIVFFTFTTDTTSTTIFTEYVLKKRDGRQQLKGTAYQSSSAQIPGPLSSFAPSVLSIACSLEAITPTRTSTDTVTATRNQTARLVVDKPSSTETITYNSTRTITLSSGITTTITSAPTYYDITTAVSTSVTTSTTLDFL